VGEGSLFIQERVASQPWIVPPIQRFILNLYNHYKLYNRLLEGYSMVCTRQALGKPMGHARQALGRPWACVKSKIRVAGLSDTRPAELSRAARTSFTGRSWTFRLFCSWVVCGLLSGNPLYVTRPVMDDLGSCFVRGPCHKRANKMNERRATKDLTLFIDRKELWADH